MSEILALAALIEDQGKKTRRLIKDKFRALSTRLDNVQIQLDAALKGDDAQSEKNAQIITGATTELKSDLPAVAGTPSP